MKNSSKKITYDQQPSEFNLFIEGNSNSLEKVKSEDELIMGPVNSSVIALNKFIRISLENNFLKDNFVKNLKIYVNYHQPILNQYDNEGLTPLTLLGQMYKSFKTNHYDFSYVANFLIEKGANPDCYTLEGKHFLSFIWNKNLQFSSFLEDYIEKGLPLGEFDIDVGNGLSELMTDCLFAEFPKMNHAFLNINDLSEKSQKKLNFYFDFLEKKRDAGLEIKTNPYCIFPQKKYMLHLKERQELIHQHVDKVKNWFYVCHKKGFDPNIPDAMGLTPVHYAIKFSNMPLLECLSDLGADLFPRYLTENIKDYAFSHQMYDYIPWATMKTEKRSLQNLPISLKKPLFKKI